MSIKKQKSEFDLFNQYKGGDLNAKKDLLHSLTPLITSQVNKFTNSGLPVFAIELEATRLAGNAIDTYDPSKAQLNTHVINNLKKISRFVTNYQNVGHIPEPRALLIGKYHTIYSNLHEDKGREPTATELADAMNVPVAEIDRLQSELRKDLSTSIIEDDEDETGFFQYLAPTGQDPHRDEAIEFVYYDADPVDKKIMEKTLGLYGNQQMTAKDIALSLKLTDAELKKRKEYIAKQISELIR